MKKCKVCEKKHHAKGLCKICYEKVYRRLPEYKEYHKKYNEKHARKTINHPDYVFQRIAIRIERQQLREILGWLK